MVPLWEARDGLEPVLARSTKSVSVSVSLPSSLAQHWGCQQGTLKTLCSRVGGVTGAGDSGKGLRQAPGRVLKVPAGQFQLCDHRPHPQLEGLPGNIPDTQLNLDLTFFNNYVPHTVWDILQTKCFRCLSEIQI